MAGLGFKDFQVGEVLTSSDVDGYLMQQTVMRFADSGARGSALGTATGTAVPLAEGMVTYLEDTDSVEMYTGTKWMKVGPDKVLSVQQAYVTVNQTISYPSVTDLTNSTITVTPVSASSKFLVRLVLNPDGALTASHSGFYYLYRNATQIGETFRADNAFSVTVEYLDSPATTSSITYKSAAQVGNIGASVVIQNSSLIVVELSS